jgi:membrane-bound lytic murein transglycosylase B
MDAVQARGRYLEDTFLAEIPALIQVAKHNDVGPLRIKGSIAGAFGIPQFLPTAFVKFGVDGDKDGKISLFNEIDALWSVGNYLSSFGWKEAKTHADQRKVIWNYNKSDAYIDAVLLMAEGIAKNRRNS